MDSMTWPLSQQPQHHSRGSSGGGEDDLSIPQQSNIAPLHGYQQPLPHHHQQQQHQQSSGLAPAYAPLCSSNMSTGNYYPRSYNDAAGEGGGGVAYSSGSSCVKPQHQSQRATGAICDGQEGSASRIGNGSPRLEGSVIQEDRGVQDNMSGGSGSGSGGTSGGNGSGPFIGESVLSMMSSPEYSQQPEMQQQMRKRDQQHERQHHQGSIQQHMQQDQLLHQQQPQQSRTSVAGGHWPPSHGAFNEDWGLLLGGSAAQATNMPASQMTQGFSSSPWSSSLQTTVGDKHGWSSAQQYQQQQQQDRQHRDDEHDSHQHFQHQQLDGHQQQRHSGPYDNQQLLQQQQHMQRSPHGSPSKIGSVPHSYASYMAQQQQQQQASHNGWSAPRIQSARPISPQNASPGDFYSAKDNGLPSLLGGGGRMPSVPGSTAASDCAEDGIDDGGLSVHQQMGAPHGSAAVYENGLRMLVAAHKTTDTVPSSTAGMTGTTGAALPRGVLEMASLKVPMHSTPAAAAAVAAAGATAGGVDSYGRDGPSASGKITGLKGRGASGVPAGGGRASKAARLNIGRGEEAGGGSKADGTGGGGAENKSTSRRRQSEESLRDLLPEERLRLNRERNRDHSRRSRERKKAFVESLKKQVNELGAYRMLVEEAHDLISAHSTDVNAVFTFASGGFDRLLGMDPAELLGVSFLDLVDPADSQNVLRSVLSTLRRGGIRQVQYRMRPPAGAHAAEVETSFRLVSSRLLAVTRVRGRSPAPSDSSPQLPSLAMVAGSQVPPPSPLMVQQSLIGVSGGRGEGGSGGLSLSPEYHGDW